MNRIQLTEAQYVDACIALFKKGLNNVDQFFVQIGQYHHKIMMSDNVELDESNKIPFEQYIKIRILAKLVSYLHYKDKLSVLCSEQTTFTELCEKIREYSRIAAKVEPHFFDMTFRFVTSTQSDFFYHDVQQLREKELVHIMRFVSAKNFLQGYVSRNEPK